MLVKGLGRRLSTQETDKALHFVLSSALFKNTSAVYLPLLTICHVTSEFAVEQIGCVHLGAVNYMSASREALKCRQFTYKM